MGENRTMALVDARNLIKTYQVDQRTRFLSLLGAQTVIVENGRIVAIGDPADVAVPDDARRIDARNRFLMPGLVEMHAHVPVAESA